MSIPSPLPRRRTLAATIAIACSGGHAAAATISVGDSSDGLAAMACNLRSAVASVNAAAATGNCAANVVGSFGSDDTIVLTMPANSTITLSDGELGITKPVAIQGDGQTIDANFASTAIHASSAALTLSDLRIINGTGAYTGGIYAGGAALTLRRVEMTYNQSPGQGGAVFAFSSPNVTIEDCFLHGNYADSSGGAIGGQNSAMTVSGSTITDNGAANGGGAISVNGGSLALDHGILIANVAANGGAITSSGTVVITDSTLAANMATNGGALYTTSSSASFTIMSSTLSGNTASNRGGAIAASFGGTFAITNSTLSGNTAASKGGAFYGDKYPKVTLTNATISGNSSAAGGGFYLGSDGSYGSTKLTSSNSVVSANTAPSGKDFAGNFQSLTGSNNLFGSAMNTMPFNAPANANVFTDAPGLGALADNGGATRTMALLSGSPAIGAGSNTAAAGLDYDQRGPGFARIAGGTVDIGAYEVLGDRVFADGFEPGT